ncbi:MAG: hypothetical protein Q8Q09_09555 [Deltaproteobacteria bacterium]|nr:hypothetical protein [Deltaproteobacteria bacterium]
MRRSFVIASVAAALSACAPESRLEPSATSPGVQPAHSTALLVIERNAGESLTPSAQIGARFVRYTGIPAEVLPSLLGTPALPAELGCHVLSDDLQMAPRAEVQLVNVGALDVHSDGQAIHLVPRRVPDLFQLVSGVVYAAEGELAGSRWQFRAEGNRHASVPSFEVEALAPSSLLSVTLDAQSVAPSSTLTLGTAPHVLRWSRGESSDRVTITFEPASPDASQPVIRCVADDSLGVFQLDSAWSDRVTRTLPGGRVTVHRMRTRPFALQGFESAAVVFDLSINARIASAQ